MKLLTVFSIVITFCYSCNLIDKHYISIDSDFLYIPFPGVDHHYKLSLDHGSAIPFMI